MMGCFIYALFLLMLLLLVLVVCIILRNRLQGGRTDKRGQGDECDWVHDVKLTKNQ